MNDIAALPLEIENLVALTELNLDQNCIVSIPDSISGLKKLKTLSLQHNQICVQSTKFSEKNLQPLPKVLFTDTLVVDLNLRGNQITNGQLNDFEGFSVFLERRLKIKSKNLYGGAMTDLSVCGLD